MFQKLFSNLRKQISNDLVETRRGDPRRESDRCIIEMEGQMFPVENWSYGGALVSADERIFGQEQDMDFTLKFKLDDSVLTLNHHGSILRKQAGKVVIKFNPLTKNIRHGFQKIVDDAAAQEFAASQAI